MDRTILLISDDRDDIESIRHLIRKHFDELIVTSLINEGIDIFKRHKPGVLMLSFPRIELAEHAYLNLFKSSEGEDTHLHETIVLCKKNDARKALRLCRENVFQDYVIDRPLYDPFRLSPAIFSAHTRLQQRFQFQASFVQTTRLREWLHRMEKMIDESRADNFLITQNQLSQYGNTIKSFDHDLIQLQQAIQQAVGAGAAQLKQEESEAAPDSTAQKGIEERPDTPYLFRKKHRLLHDPQTSARGNILVVEDDAIQHKVLRHLLEPTNLKMEFAENGLEVFDVLRRGMTDIILMDIGLPGIDGIDITRLIKQNPEFRDIPIITLTSHSEKQMVEDSIKAGAVDYIVKPVDLNHLLEKINAHLPAVKRVRIPSLITEQA